MKLRWRFCREAEAEHKKNRRQYAHTFHHGEDICLCRAFWDLPKPYRDGILLHEIGHLLAGPQGSEMQATRAAEEYFDVPIHYVDSPHGRSLERLANMARRRRRNPEEEIPFGEWIPAKAVMFNEDGTVSVETESMYLVTENGGRQRNAQAELLGRLHGFDYWRVGDEVYRSHPDSGGYMTAQGLPSDVRWESSYAHFLRYIKPQMAEQNRGRRHRVY